MKLSILIERVVVYNLEVIVDVPYNEDAKTAFSEFVSQYDSIDDLVDSSAFCPVNGDVSLSKAGDEIILGTRVVSVSGGKLH